jgi:hypothetical protein
MKYKIGDIVTFKTWENMKKEFGLNVLGEICCNKTFVRGMESKLMSSKTRDVEIFIVFDNYYHVLINNEVMKKSDGDWIYRITDDMLEEKNTGCSSFSLEFKFNESI